MKAIIAVNNSNYIGLNGALPWKSSEDLQHFKQMTDGCKLLVGYNTAISLCELPNRQIVIDKENIDTSEIDWCIGGAKTLEKYCHLFTELHISHIDDNTIGDTFLPSMKNLNSNCKIFHYHFKTNKNK